MRAGCPPPPQKKIARIEKQLVRYIIFYVFTAGTEPLLRVGHQICIPSSRKIATCVCSQFATVDVSPSPSMKCCNVRKFLRWEEFSINLLAPEFDI
jgi:hypothetical protein